MKLKVIQGGKGKKKKARSKTQSPMEDYYAKERPRAQDMEKAEGDEDIVESALKNQRKKGEAA